MTIDQLNSQFSLPQHIFFAAGPGGITQAHINNEHATASVSLLGGQLLTFRPNGEQPLLWMSQLAKYEVGEAIRGGVPVIFPWFGPHPERPDLGAHGLVRDQLWRVVGSEATESGETKLVLGIDVDGRERGWDGMFSAEITITIGRQCTVTLTATNTGPKPFRWSGALHTYFAIGNIGSTPVAQLDGVTFKDKVHGGKHQQDGLINFTEETDRVYLDTTATTHILDNAQHRQIIVEKTNSDSTVVWNPGETAKKADLAEGDYSNFLCIEAAVAAGAATIDQMQLLQPNETCTFSTTIHAQAL